MDEALKNLSNDPEKLKNLIEKLVGDLNKKDEQITKKNQLIDKKQSKIETLEEQLRSMQRQRFGAKSEKNPDQFELQLFNEAEVALEQAEPEAEAVTVPAHQRKKASSRKLPEDLPRVDVTYDLPDDEKHCDCGLTLDVIGEITLEQLAVIPLQYYVIRHIRKKYACCCKACIKTASMPKQTLPKSGASAVLLSHIIVSKFSDGLPLYRQEKIAAREGIELSRTKMARWVIDGADTLQPLINCLEDEFISHDIAWTDETGIQVLKENGRKPENKSQLWIRRGGPPDKPVVLVDYSPSRSGEIAYGLLKDFQGYLVADAYPGYNKVIQENELKFVACNDHARRKFVEAIKNLDKKMKNKGWIANKAIQFYKKLYKIEADAKALSPAARYQVRQTQSVPLWQAFHDWLQTVYQEGVAHTATREAMEYALKLWPALTRYCDDGRLPISNIQAEQVAKSIAIARKNFLFADTPAGAHASAKLFSLLETAKANGHNPHHYLTLVFTELPNAETVDDIDALLPWNISPEQVKLRFLDYPKP